MHKQPHATLELAARERTDGRPDKNQPRWVSTTSRWQHQVWYLDNSTDGATRAGSAIYWPDVGARLLNHLKSAIWSLLTHPQGAAAPKIGGMASMTTGIKFLGLWMEYRDYADFGELRPESCDQFLDDLIQYNLNGGRFDRKRISLVKLAPGEVEEDPDLTEKAVWSRVSVWHTLDRQRAALDRLGIPSLKFPPFGGQTAQSIVTETATKLRQRTPPIPDEIALPILQQAHVDIGVPADDLLELLDRYLAEYPIGQRWSSTTSDRANAVVTDFAFGEAVDGAGPWHLGMRDDGEGDCSAPVMLKRMIRRVRAACTIVLHAAAGVRIGELCSIEAGWTEGAEFPDCVEVRPSKTGYNDILFLRGRLSKEEDQPTRVEWVIGSRPRGSTYVPSAAKALRILERLHRPWRGICEDERLRSSLMLNLSSHNGLPRSAESLGLITTHTLRREMNAYIGDNVEWRLLTIPDTSRHGEDLTGYRETRGGCIRPHQWRKTFALFIFRVDANMVGALAQQFKHLSLAMTEGAYIGNDPALLQTFDDVQLQQTVRFFHERATGRSLAAGRVGKLIERHRRDMDRLIAGATGPAEQRARIETFCIEQDLRIWYASHGKCLIGLSPKSARCHMIAGTSHFSNKVPAFEARSPATCAGCDCFATDPEHLPFWEKRAADGAAAVERASALGHGADYRVVAERARQAQALVSEIRRKDGSNGACAE